MNQWWPQTPCSAPTAPQRAPSGTKAGGPYRLEEGGCRCYLWVYLTPELFAWRSPHKRMCGFQVCFWQINRGLGNGKSWSCVCN